MEIMYLIKMEEIHDILHFMKIRGIVEIEGNRRKLRNLLNWMEFMNIVKLVKMY